MPRLTSAASIPVLLWAMPKYVRPPAPPLIQAVVNSQVRNPTFKGYLLTPEDREYLITHGMPNGSGWAIDDTPAPLASVGVAPYPLDSVAGEEGSVARVG